MTEFEWDAAKAESNVVKHGVRFASAVQVVDDARAITVEDDRDAEVRFATMGMDDLGRILVVV